VQVIIAYAETPFLCCTLALSVPQCIDTNRRCMLSLMLEYATLAMKAVRCGMMDVGSCVYSPGEME
jgi:hypothetical protein